MSSHSFECICGGAAATAAACCCCCWCWCRCWCWCWCWCRCWCSLLVVLMLVVLVVLACTGAGGTVSSYKLIAGRHSWFEGSQLSRFLKPSKMFKIIVKKHVAVIEWNWSNCRDRGRERIARIISLLSSENKTAQVLRTAPAAMTAGRLYNANCVGCCRLSALQKHQGGSMQSFAKWRIRMNEWGTDNVEKRLVKGQQIKWSHSLKRSITIKRVVEKCLKWSNFLEE